MTTVYKFKAGYKKAGVATAPSSTPTITVVDTDDNVLVNAQNATALANLTGGYIYEYSGADSLDLVGRFRTADTTMDETDLFCVAEYNPVDIWGYVTRTITSGGITAAQVWDHLLTSISTAGSIGKLIEDYLDAAVSSRATPNSPVASTAATVSGTTITVLRGDSLVITFTDLGSLANLSKLYFSVKQWSGQADSESFIQIEKAAGLLYINQAAATTAANGTITVDDSPTGDITVTLTAAEMAKLPLYSYTYDVQLVRSSGVPVSTLTSGTFVVSGDITRATS